jgi:hypothetical protein
MFGERCSNQASATDIGVVPKRLARKRRGLQGAEAAEREEGHVRDALIGEGVDQLVVVAVGEVPDEALVLEFDERPEGFGERAGLRTLGVSEPEVDHVEPL